MNWASWPEFWAMGGHGFYVWMSYGVALVAIVAEIVALRRGRAKARSQIEAERDLETTD
jgi:heme exporter protein D